MNLLHTHTYMKEESGIMYEGKKSLLKCVHVTVVFPDVYLVELIGLLDCT